MTQPEEQIDWEQFAEAELYKRLIKTHGKVRAKQKLLFILKTPREHFGRDNIEVIDYGKYGAEKCFCGHPIRYGFIVNETIVGGTCLGYLMNYLKISTRHIELALRTMNSNKHLAEFGLAKRSIKITKLDDEYHKANAKYHQQKESGLINKLKNIIKDIAGTAEEISKMSSIRTLLSHVNDTEAKFIVLLIKDKGFLKFLKEKHWIGKIDKKDNKLIVVKWLQQMMVKNLSEKQIPHIENAMTRYVKGELSHLTSGEKEFLELVKENPDFRLFLSTTWIGKPDNKDPTKLVYEKFVDTLQTRNLSEKQWKWVKKFMFKYLDQISIDEERFLKEFDDLSSVPLIPVSKDTECSSGLIEEESPISSSSNSPGEALLAKYRKKNNE